MKAPHNISIPPRPHEAYLHDRARRISRDQGRAGRLMEFLSPSRYSVPLPRPSFSFSRSLYIRRVTDAILPFAFKRTRILLENARDTTSAHVTSIHEENPFSRPAAIYIYVTVHLAESWRESFVFRKTFVATKENRGTTRVARENKSAEKAEILSFKSADIKSVMKLRNKGEV